MYGCGVGVVGFVSEPPVGPLMGGGGGGEGGGGSHVTCRFKKK